MVHFPSSLSSEQFSGAHKNNRGGKKIIIEGKVSQEKVGTMMHRFWTDYMHLRKLIPELKIKGRTSLVVQRLRICLPMQGTQVWSLVQEDSTYHGAIKPVCHRYWACAPWWEACELQLESSLHSPQLEKAHAQPWKPSTAKNKNINH